MPRPYAALAKFVVNAAVSCGIAANCKLRQIMATRCYLKWRKLGFCDENRNIAADMGVGSYGSCHRIGIFDQRKAGSLPLK